MTTIHGGICPKCNIRVWGVEAAVDHLITLHDADLWGVWIEKSPTSETGLL